LLDTETLNAAPTKKTLRDKANTANLKRCFAELIDNCIDFWRAKEKHKEKPLKIDIDISRDQGSNKSPKPIKKVQIEWDLCIPHNYLKPLVTLGESGLEDGNIIGLWGQGAKIGTHGLARGWRITSYDNDKKYIIEVPEDWILREKDWELELKIEKNKSNKNFTKFETTKLHPEKWKEETQNEDVPSLGRNQPIEHELRDYIGSTYSEFEDIGEGLEIKINDRKLELHSVVNKDTLENEFLWIPGYEPHVDIWGPKKFSDGDELKVNILVGFHRNPSKEKAGVYLYGNARKFLNAHKKSPIYTKYHAEQTRLRIHVFLKGPSDKIPWGIPEKEGLNEDHPSIKDISKWIHQSVEPLLNSRIFEDLPTKQMDIYSMRGNLDNLMSKAQEDGNFDDEEKETLIKLIKNLRNIEFEEKYVNQKRKRGSKYRIDCLNKKYQRKTKRLLKSAKKEKNFFKFHLKIAEVSRHKRKLLKGIDISKFEKKLEKDSAEKEEKEINSDDRDLSTKDNKFSTQVQNKNEGEKENQEKKKIGNENNKTKKYTQTTLNSFNQNLDELGKVLEIDNREVLLGKITKAIKKIKKELDKDFMTEDARLYKEILELEEN